MNNPRWASFLVYKENDKRGYQYAEGYRDDSVQHEDYDMGIHISMPDYLSIYEGSDFEFGANKMKAIHVQPCSHFKNHKYVFAKTR